MIEKKIFITLGSQKFQFNRILKEIDLLIENNFIDPKNVFAQIGSSNYNPIHFKFTKFLTMENFKTKIENSDIIITHGGTGAIISSLKCEKVVIAIARLQKFNEHIDDHQIQIIDAFTFGNYILGTSNEKDILNLIKKSMTHTFCKYESNTEHFLNNLNCEIRKMMDI